MKNNCLGKNIKTLRLECGLSQKKLGKQLGVCNQTVSFGESGQREPDVDSLIVLAKFFEVTVDYIVGLED